MTDCTTCRKLRDDWLNAMIALDVARVARVTGQAVKHMIAAPEDEAPPPEKPKRKRKGA